MHPETAAALTPENGGARQPRGPGRLLKCLEIARVLPLPDVRCLRALRSFRHLVLDLLAFGETAETFHLDGGVVDEHVLPSAIRSYEAIALCIVEPLHSTSCHSSSLSQTVPGQGTPG